MNYLATKPPLLLPAVSWQVMIPVALPALELRQARQALAPANGSKSAEQTLGQWITFTRWVAVVLHIDLNRPSY